MGKRLSTALRAIALAAMIATLVALSGCSGGGSSSRSDAGAASSASSASSAGADETKAPAADLVLGTRSSTTADVLLVNMTGENITAASVRPTTSEGTPVELMEAGAAWADGQIADVFYEPSGIGLYNLFLTCGGASYELHELDLASIGEAEIRLESGVAYVTYERDGSTVSTLEIETAIREAALQSEADSAAAAEAGAQAAAEGSASDGQSYYDDSQSYYEQPAQTEDSCVEGGVVLR